MKLLNQIITLLLLSVQLLSTIPVCAQSLPYTQKLYNYKLYSDIPYGTATDYAGKSVELMLDIYKPLNDQNCRRPIFIMVHGGSFIAGHKSEGAIPAICAEMAQRGYVVASISYRLGTHKATYYQPYALCGNGTALDLLPGAKCAYSADSLEFIRGYYRGVQDAKAAVRYMKSRAAVDSTDVNNVYIGGESAGGFIALGVGYMDMESEKPAAAYALAAAPTPDTDLLSCLPSSYDLSRPDLGSVEGMLNTTNPNINSRVQGVANFTGGVIWNLYEGNSKPPVYLYHLTADPVVPCNYQKAYSGFSAAINAINLCQPINGILPYVYGSCAIADYFESLGTAASPSFYNDIVNNGAMITDVINLVNKPSHYIDNVPLRISNMSNFFAPFIVANGNGGVSANCEVGLLPDYINTVAISVQPNPCSGTFYFQLPQFHTQVRCQLLDINGGVLDLIVPETTADTQQYRVTLPNNRSAGIYLLKILADNQNYYAKIAVNN